MTRRAWPIHPPARSGVRFVPCPRVRCSNAVGTVSELIVQLSALKLYGNARKTSDVGRAVGKVLKLLRLTASLFALGPELPTLLAM